MLRAAASGLFGCFTFMVTSVPRLPRIKATTSRVDQPTTSCKFSPSLATAMIKSLGCTLPDLAAGPPSTKVTIWV